MDLAVRAFPLRDGQETALRDFAAELKGRRSAEAADFYRRFGVSRETWHLQDTPSGPWVIAVTLSSGRPISEAASEYAGSAVEFDQWFKQQVLSLTGVDPETQPLGPPTECVFDTQDMKP
jgi:hypothetical protein